MGWISLYNKCWYDLNMDSLFFFLFLLFSFTLFGCVLIYIYIYPYLILLHISLSLSPLLFHLSLTHVVVVVVVYSHVPIIIRQVQYIYNISTLLFIINTKVKQGCCACTSFDRAGKDSTPSPARNRTLCSRPAPNYNWQWATIVHIRLCLFPNSRATNRLQHIRHAIVAQVFGWVTHMYTQKTPSNFMLIICFPPHF